MELLIVTGQSGAGKTRVINALEDIGYYCVDNIPPALLGDFADLNYSPVARYGRTAIVMDARSGRMFRELPAALEELHRQYMESCSTMGRDTRYILMATRMLMAGCLPVT